MQNKIPISGISLIKRTIVLFLYLFLVTNCTKTEEVNLAKKNQDFPSRIIKNGHIIYKDSGQIVLNLRSPLIEEYAAIDTPYTKFPKGLEMNFYNKSIDSPGFLKANWALMNEGKGWYEGRGDVVVINEKGDTLKTEKLFWNKKLRKVFTKDTVFIISNEGDSLQANNGLEAKDDLSEYKLFDNQGTKFYLEEKN